jgi:hypothetical protein
MPWPQLIDPEKAAAGEPHPLVAKFGLDGPAKFVIDKKGVCRSVNAYESYEALIAKLLAE